MMNTPPPPHPHPAAETDIKWLILVLRELALVFARRVEGRYHLERK